MIKNRSTQSWLLFIALSLIWGSAFLLIKRGNEAFTPLQGASIRILTGAIVLCPIALRNLRKKYSKQEWLFLFISGLVGSYTPAMLFATAQTSITSSTAGVLSSLTPVFTAIISILFFKNKLSAHQYFGLALGLLGAIMLATLKDGSIDFSNMSWLLVVGATFCYAINLNFLKFKLEKVEPFTIAAMSLFLVSPFALFNLFNSDFTSRLIPENTDSFLYLILLGATATSLALILFNKLLKIASPQFASSTTYAIPVIAICWGIFDNEVINQFQLIAITCILGGLFLLKKS